MQEDNLENKSLWHSGLWTGFWTEPNRKFLPFRNPMDLDLTFREKRITGSGVDSVNAFIIIGSYTK